MGSPTSEEQAAKDAEARAREEKEQAALPYKWTQRINDVDITIRVPGNFKGRDLDVSIGKDKIKAGVKGQAAVLEVRRKDSKTEITAHVTSGLIPAPDPRRRIDLDTRNTRLQRLGKGTVDPPRKSQQDGVVAARRDLGARDRHVQDPAREQQIVRLGRRDAVHGGEDDV